jgi:hypothetical protein
MSPTFLNFNINRFIAADFLRRNLAWQGELHMVENNFSLFKSAMMGAVLCLTFMSTAALTEGSDQCTTGNHAWCQCGGPGSPVSQSRCLRNYASCEAACGMVGSSEPASEGGGLSPAGVVISSAVIGGLAGSFAGPAGAAAGLVIGTVIGFAIPPLVNGK